MIKTILIGAAFISIAACTRVPVTSIPKLSSIDGKTTDLNAIQVVVKAPDYIRMQPDSIVLNASITGDFEDDYQTVLEPIATPADISARFAGEGYQVRVYELADDEAARLNTLREGVIAAREAGGEGVGKFGVNVNSTKACIDKDAENSNLRTNVWIKTSETGELVHALRNVDLFEELSNEDVDPADLYCKD